MKKTLTVMLLALVVTSCEKPNNKTDKISPDLQQKATTVSSEMRVFKTFDEFTNELNKVLKMSLEDRVQYEKSIGFNSFGTIAENIYHSFAGDEEKLDKMTREQILDYFKQNSEFIQIVTESDGTESAETKYFRSSFSYLMNKNCMFQVEDIVFKVFESGYAMCNVKYYDELINLSENAFLLLKEDNKITPYYFDNKMHKETGNFGKYVERQNTNGKERVKVWVKYVLNDPNLPPVLEVFSRGQRKTTGIFFWAKRHITNDIFVMVMVQGKSYSFIERYSTAGAVYSSGGTFMLPPSMDGYIAEMTGYAKIPAVTYWFP